MSRGGNKQNAALVFVCISVTHLTEPFLLMKVTDYSSSSEDSESSDEDGETVGHDGTVAVSDIPRIM